MQEGKLPPDSRSDNRFFSVSFQLCCWLSCGCDLQMECETTRKIVERTGSFIPWYDEEVFQEIRNICICRRSDLLSAFKEYLIMSSEIEMVGSNMYMS
jgi:hypothetical protein